MNNSEPKLPPGEYKYQIDRVVDNDNGTMTAHAHLRHPTMQLVFEMLYGRERALAAASEKPYTKGD